MLFPTAGKRITASDEIKQIRWATWTGVLGSEANGIWLKYADTSDVNAVYYVISHSWQKDHSL